MTTSIDAPLQWLRRYPGPDGPDGSTESRPRLLCLPHAGGSASFYFPLARALAEQADVVVVQYPGRQDRRDEPTIDQLPVLAEHVIKAIVELAGEDAPLAIFGHSMGAIVGYEVALGLADRDLPAPSRLFASGRRAPSCYRNESIHELSDEGLLSALRGLGATDPVLLNDPELQAMILPAVRGDYTAIETYRHTPGRALTCPVTVLVGAADQMVSIDEAASWSGHTTGPTDLQVFPGGHFYLAERSEDVIAAVAERLTQ